MLEELDAQFGIGDLVEKEMTEQKTKKYNRGDLSGMLIEHEMKRLAWKTFLSVISDLTKKVFIFINYVEFSHSLRIFFGISLIMETLFTKIFCFRFEEGRTTILTLKDSNILDDKEDTLVNVNMVDDEHVEKVSILCECS